LSPTGWRASISRHLLMRALYSTYTWLAYTINRTFYGDVHYVWCTPHFDPKSPFLGSDSAVPPTSSPREIYDTLFEEVQRGDRHSPKIDQNRLGVLRGADLKLRQGAISTEAHADILAIAGAAQSRDFRPLLFVVPFAAVSAMARQVPVKDRAHPLSEEFILEGLPRATFDVWEIRK
jgi:hypothetical protein